MIFPWKAVELTHRQVPHTYIYKGEGESEAEVITAQRHPPHFRLSAPLLSHWYPAPTKYPVDLPPPPYGYSMNLSYDRYSQLGAHNDIIQQS